MQHCASNGTMAGCATLGPAADPTEMVKAGAVQLAQRSPDERFKLQAPFSANAAPLGQTQAYRQIKQTASDSNRRTTQLMERHRAHLSSLALGAPVTSFPEARCRGFAADTACSGEQAVGQANGARRWKTSLVLQSRPVAYVRRATANQATEFRQGFPLGVPETRAAPSCSCGTHGTGV